MKIKFLILFVIAFASIRSFSQESVFFVKGDLYIGSEVIVKSGDLVLKDAAISGKAKLILESSKSQEIKSQNSSIENLEINTNSRISVWGDLVIKDNLLLLKGEFNTQKATVIVEDENQIFLNPRSRVVGKLFNKNKEEIQLIQSKLVLSEMGGYFYNRLITTAAISINHFIFTKQFLYNENKNDWHRVLPLKVKFFKILLPPPEFSIS